MRFELYYVFARLFGYRPKDVDELPLSYIVYVLRKVKEEKLELLERELLREVGW